MSVFTLYAFGTDERLEMKTDKKNIISSFVQATHPKPTKANEMVTDPETKNASMVLNGPQFHPLDPRGTLQIEKNVDKAIASLVSWLKNAKPGNDGYIHLNLMGFSRGCVTNREILNRLKTEIATNPELNNNKDNLKKLKILLYENDPVAGMFDKASAYKTHIPNISIDEKSIPIEHIAIIQENEMRRDFKPQDISRTHIESYDSIHSTFLPMYGNHSDGVKYKSSKIGDCSILNYNIAYRALRNNGTDLENMPKMYGTIDKGKYGEIDIAAATDRELLEHFSLAKQHREDYEKSGKKFKMAFEGIPLLAKTKRSFVDQREYYVQDSEFFVNQFDRELFKTVYPKTFNYLFEHAMDAQTEKVIEGEKLEQLKIEVRQELAIMRKVNSNLFKRLEERNVYYKDGQMNIPSTPQGYYRIENCNFLATLNGKNNYEGTYLHQLNKLEKQIIAMTFIYQRQKSEYMAFFNKVYHEEATTFRETLKTTLNSNDSIENKYRNALKYFEEQYADMYKRGTKSELKNNLKEILEFHGYRFQLNEGKSNILEKMGQGINLAGKFFIGTSNVILSIFGLPGTIIEDAGRRINDITTMGTIIGIPLRGIGYSIKKGFGIPFLINQFGSAVRKLGNFIIKASNVRNVKFTKSEIGIKPVEILKELHVNNKEEITFKQTSVYSKSSLDTHGLQPTDSKKLAEIYEPSEIPIAQEEESDGEDEGGMKPHDHSHLF